MPAFVQARMELVGASGFSALGERACPDQAGLVAEDTQEWRQSSVGELAGRRGQRHTDTSTADQSFRRLLGLVFWMQGCQEKSVDPPFGSPLPAVFLSMHITLTQASSVCK